MVSLHFRPRALARLGFSACATFLWAQDNKEIVTDRPDITESAIVVPKGSLQFENGATWTHDHRAKSFDIPETLVRFGLSERTEFRLAAPLFLASPLHSSFSDLSVGIKQQFGPLPAGFELSLIAAVSLPTGRKGFSSGGVDPFVKFPWSRELHQGWSVGGMQSFFWNSEASGRNTVWEPTFYLEKELTRPWDVFLEYGGDYAGHGNGSKQLMHAGSAYKIKRTHQVDFHFGFGLNHQTPNHFFAVGYSFRLDAGTLRKK